ncbi:membrane fusion protein (multidrug efflux system) [Sphingomonas vulcanisoli]|uniref:Membrane fusion protein (Multidrug efflux system) n=1 Tax=Sphingomonas vulcanisoli TaxID=1658060 RepID=A0ABX0TV03_9SPHN|nr:efflux RND transporter periplasmic adaptor subunit [Sphingomonas vulcanisoli]NIJ09276.1 membrane fusion protein (multidrug efflux system) [Sphingomonas vulcanisoli]
MTRLLLCTLAAAGTVLSGCGKAPPPAPPPPSVGFVTLKTEPVTLTTELPGRISAMETSDVRPQVSGVVRERLFKEGSIVHAGQILYVIEDAPYRASLLNAQGQLAQAQATIRSTALQADRYRQLAGANAVSKQDADNADASARQAQAQVITARGSVRTAQVNLGFTRVRAPITGRIGRSLVTPGALVANGQSDALATIQRMDSVYVDVSQSAAQLLDLKAAVSGGGVSRQEPDSARVQLLLPNGQTYGQEGKLEFAEVTVDQNTGSVTLRATFPNPDGMLLPGLYVRARIVEGVQTQGLLVPQAGISRNERGQATALVLGPDDKLQPRVVTTRQTVGDKWLVTAGLKPGDRVVTEGLVGVMPGMKVQAHPAGTVPPAPPPGAPGSQPGQGHP